jgi:monovalent cation/proton antiporter MnhG/PhaG subunit
VTAVDLAADVLLVLGVGAELVCVAGLVIRTSVYDRLHYAGAATTIGPGFVVFAVALRESVPPAGGFEVNSSGLETVVAGLLLFLLNPVLVHATARAARLRERGTLEARARERRAP